MKIVPHIASPKEGGAQAIGGQGFTEMLGSFKQLALGNGNINGVAVVRRNRIVSQCLLRQVDCFIVIATSVICSIVVGIALLASCRVYY